jgi:hypothetical protein
MPEKDLITLLGSDNWLDNLLLTLLDDDLLLSLGDRELALVRAHVIRELASSPDVAKIVGAKAEAVAKRLKARAGK